MNLANQWFKIRLAWRLALARQAGVVFGGGVRVARGVDFNLGGGFHNILRPSGPGAGSIRIEDHCWIEQASVLWAFGGSIRIAPSVFLGPCVVIYGHGGVEIGERTLVSMHCSIVSSNHGVPRADKKIRDAPDQPLPTRIGRDCWLGAGVRVLGGVTVGEGCVIGAGAVVTRDLPPFSIAVGLPARVVGSRNL